MIELPPPALPVEPPIYSRGEILGAVYIPPVNEINNNVFQYPDKMPEFKGGIDHLNHFIKKHLNYPKWERKNKIEGKVIARFIIDENGKVQAPEITRSVPGSKNFNKEVIRILKKMPDWIPGSHEGKNVKTEFYLPFTFKLD